MTSVNKIQRRSFSLTYQTNGEFNNKMSDYIHVMLRLSFLVLVFGFTAFSLHGQEYEYIDKVYDAQIKSVKFHLDGLRTSYPLVDLNSPARLLLTFDDFAEEEASYFFTLIHCDAQWNKSPIEPQEYLTTFEEGEIEEWHYSEATFWPYTHYRLKIPNEEVRWSISGNYILMVYYYDEDDNRIPIITRRFMVSEGNYLVDHKFVYPIKTEQIRSHHELQVNIDTQEDRLIAPRDQLKLFVYQNGRWDQKVENLSFNRYLGSKFYYDFPGKIVLPAGKEFRHFDMRNLRGGTGDMAIFDRDENGYTCIPYVARPLLHEPYFFSFDINGQYLIENSQEPLVTINNLNVANQNLSDSTVIVVNSTAESFKRDSLCLQCDYAKVLFTLEVRQPYREDVYVFGAFSDWELKPEYQMFYDEDRKAYLGEFPLKQGYYNYHFALDKGGPNTSAIEGDWHETENDYLLLFYNRHIFNQYDRLVAAKVVNSGRQ